MTMRYCVFAAIDIWIIWYIHTYVLQIYIFYYFFLCVLVCGDCENTFESKILLYTIYIYIHSNTMIKSS